jgi:hypothetical protein
MTLNEEDEDVALVSWFCTSVFGFLLAASASLDVAATYRLVVQVAAAVACGNGSTEFSRDKWREIRFEEIQDGEYSSRSGFEAQIPRTTVWAMLYLASTAPFKLPLDRLRFPHEKCPFS